MQRGYLGLWFLLAEQLEVCSLHDLDLKVERYLQESRGVQVYFELSDGIRKLREAGLIKVTAGNLIKPCRLANALTCVDQEWDAMFSFGDLSAQPTSRI